MLFSDFCTTADAIGAIGSSLAKRKIAVEYIGRLDESSLRLACLYLSGMPFPSSDGRTINIGAAAYRDALMEIYPDLTQEKFDSVFNQYSDLGKTVEAIIDMEKQVEVGIVDLKEVDAFYTEVAATKGSIAKRKLMAEFFRKLTAAEVKYIQKITSGDLRIGFKEGQVENAIAVAFSQELPMVRLANMKTGDAGYVALLAKHNELQKAEFKLFHPLKVMLATAEATSEDIVTRFTKEEREITVEDKYDGMRCHLHHENGRIELYTRDLNKVTHSFPELNELKFSNTVLLDGEIVGIRDGNIVAFNEFQKRLGRKEVTKETSGNFEIKYMLYDIIYLDGQLLIDEPLSKRRELFRSLKLPPQVIISEFRKVADAHQIEVEFDKAVGERGNEGLMIKDPASKYTVGKRGYDWIKYKKALEPFDVVVTAAEQGHGKKNEYLSDLTFAVWDKDKLVNLGKAYSGLSDSDVKELTEWFRANTVQIEGRKHLVKPEIILEIAYENIQKSDRHESGYALRFPRIKAIRKDKPVSEINTLADVAHIYEKFCS